MQKQKTILLLNPPISADSLLWCIDIQYSYNQNTTFCFVTDPNKHAYRATDITFVTLFTALHRTCTNSNLVRDERHQNGITLQAFMKRGIIVTAISLK